MALGYEDEVVARGAQARAASRVPRPATLSGVKPTPMTGVTRPPLGVTASSATTNLLRKAGPVAALGTAAYGAGNEIVNTTAGATPENRPERALKILGGLDFTGIGNAINSFASRPPIAPPGAVATPAANGIEVGPPTDRDPSGARIINGVAEAAPVATPPANPLGKSVDASGNTSYEIINPAAAVAPQPMAAAGLTVADQQAQLQRNAADKAELAGIEKTRDINNLRAAATVPLNLSGGIGDLANSVNARKIAKGELQSAIQQQGQEALLSQRQTYDSPLQQAQIGTQKAQTGKLNQDVATGAQDAAQKVQLIQLRDKYMTLNDQNDPNGKQRSEIERQSTILSGKDVKDKYTPLMGKDELGNPVFMGAFDTKTGQRVEQGAASPQKVKGTISTVNGKTAMWDGTKWVPQ